MHASAMQSAKKKALSELIRHMRKRELKEGSPAEEKAESPEEEALEVDDTDDTDDGVHLGGNDDEGMDDGDGDPRAELEQFMKHGGRRPSKTRASVVIAVKSPMARMKKTFGKA